MMIKEIGKEPKIYFNYQKSYDLADAARLKLKRNGWKILRLFKYSYKYWAVEYKKADPKDEYDYSHYGCDADCSKRNRI